MIKKGFTKVFLVLCLMFASSIVFVACKESKVKVSSIAFKETENITMIVGQTYNPKVSVLPSYANNRSYSFSVESNSDIIKISGGSIVALKEGVVQLKVVSNENGYLTDMIAVRVLPTAIKLDAPTNLQFDGEKFSFSSVNYATSYFMQINDDEEIELGNSTSYTLEQYQAKLGMSAYDKVLNVKVRAVGDERITVPSGYSSVISVLKISAPYDVVVENNVYKFTKIKNVEKYNLSFYTLEDELFVMELNAGDYVGDEIAIDLTAYKDIFTGGQYFAKLTATDKDYVKVDNEKVIPSNDTVLAFDVLSKPTNLVISNYVLYWDSVLGANDYTLFDSDNKVLRDKIATTSIDLKELGLAVGSHSYKLVANSNQNINVISSVNISEVITVRLLEKPNVDIEDKNIVWDSVAGATSYHLIIYKNNGEVEKDINLVANSYSVANYVKGDYRFEIYSCGDNKKTLTSLDYSTGTFKVLAEATGLKVENKKILWNSVEGTKFDVKIYNSTSAEPYIHEIKDEKEFDISGYDFAPDEYTVKIETLGEGNVFNSKIVSTKFYKLSEIKDVKISNKVISFTIDGRTDNTQIVCYDINDKNVIYDVLTAKSKSQYSLDPTDLPAGQFKVEVFAYGNNGNVLDANNSADTRFLEIKKLSTSSLSVDTAEFKVYKTKDVDYAEKYELYENGGKIATFANDEDYKHNVKTLTPGEYEYTIKAIGNNKDVLDGEMSSTSVKVLKLDTPKLSFNYNTLVYTITTNEEQDEYVAGYDFTVNGKTDNIIFNGKTADCTNVFTDSGEYIANLRLLAKTSAKYDLIMNSDLVERNPDIKINSTASLKVKGSMIIITPDQIGADGRKNYTPTISIGYGEGENYTYIDYKEAVYDATEKGYVFNVYDENYNVNVGPKKEDGSFIFAEPGTFKFKLLLERKNYITSDVFDITTTVVKLDSVKDISKYQSDTSSDVSPTEKITFKGVDLASKYLLKVVNGKNVYEVELEPGTTEMTVADIKNMVEDKYDPTHENKTDFIGGGKTYTLQLIALGDDSARRLSSVPSQNFTMQLITWPTKMEIDENSKLLKITINTSVQSVVDYIYVSFKDSKNKYYYTKLNYKNGETTVSLDSVSGLATGKITVKACVVSKNDNSFKSNENSTSYTQLDKNTISVKDGLLTWKADKNAKAYLLTYKIGSEVKEITLSSGSTNFNITDEEATYELKNVDVGTSDITVQSLGGVITTTNPDTGQTTSTYYYDSPISDLVRITKLAKPEVVVKNGVITINLNAVDFDNDYIKSVKINGKDLKEYSATFEKTITIKGENLLEYNSEKSIDEEKFIISLQANTVEGSYILNAEDCPFSAWGLKPVVNIGIKTDYNPANEIIESIDSIEWTPNTLNSELVSGYIINIFYDNNVDEYRVENPDATLFTFPKNPSYGAGDYKITIRTLTNEDGYVHSKEQTCTITVCDQPKNLKTSNGLVVWDTVRGASEYIVYVCDKDNENNVLYSKETSVNEFDFKCLPDFNAGLYKVKVFATNKGNNSIVTGKLSESLEVYRVPEITKYKVDEGKLYLYTHSYATAVELKLTSKKDSKIAYTYTLNLTEVLPEGEKWSDVNNLENYLKVYDVDDKTVGWKYSLVGTEKDDDIISVLNMLDGQYNLEVMAIGNTSVDAKNVKLATVNSKVTTNINNLANNYQLTDTDTDYVEKLSTPNIEIPDISGGEENRGLVNFGTGIKTYNSCIYYDLQGLLIYDVCISSGDTDYSFFVVDNYYKGCIKNSLLKKYAEDEIDTNTSADGRVTTYTYDGKSISITVYTTEEGFTYYGYIKYEYEEDEYLYLNIMRYKESVDSDYIGKLQIDFKNDKLFFVDKDGAGNIEGKTETEIDVNAGGNFKVSVSILGDNTLYLTSNTSKVVSVVRYGQLDLFIKDGFLTWANQKVDADNPIYRLEITQNMKDSKVKSLVYIYAKGTTLNKNILPAKPEDVDDSRIYYVEVEYVVEGQIVQYLSYMLDTVDDSGYVFNGGNYTVQITTLFNAETDSSKLESRASAAKTFEKLASPAISITGGVIKWNQITVGNTNIQNYQVIIAGVKEQPVVYKISQKDYTISDKEITYILPQIITDINGNEYTLIGGLEDKYQINIFAVEDANYVNSNASNTLEFDISEDVENLEMKDGKVVWTWGDESSEGSYEVKIIIYENGKEITTCYTTVHSKSFSWDSNLNDENGASVDFVKFGDQYSYAIYVKRIGNDTTLTGFFTAEGVRTEKLKAVNTDSITSNQGVLTWSAITGLNGQTLNVNYVIEFVGTELENYIVENATSFDFSGSDYNPGKYTIKITPIHSKYFTGNTTTEVVVYKLDSVGAITNPEIWDEENKVYVKNVLQWNAVYVDTDENERIYADQYEIEINGVLQEPVEDSKKSGILQFSLASMNTLDTKVRVRAVISSETGKVINAEWSAYTEFSRPNSVSSDYFTINNGRFEWRAIVDEQPTTDKYVLRYSYKKSASEGSFINTSLIVSSFDEITEGGELIKVYYFIPAKIGYYTDISVTVNRGSDLSSETVTMKDGEVNASYTFDKFASGEGTESSPYVITEVAHLLNINIFADKHFVLRANLNLSGIDKMLIDDTFTGSIDGYYKDAESGVETIYALENYTLSSSETMVGMFRKLVNATIKNIKINYIKIKINLEYDKVSSYGGILAGEAINSNIENVNITNSVLNINSEDNTGGSEAYFYYGGMFGYLNNTNITNSSIKLGYLVDGEPNYSTLVFKGSNWDTVYFGGVAGYAEKSTFAGDSTNWGPTTENYNVEIYYSIENWLDDSFYVYPNVYFGGVFGVMKESSVSYAKVNVNQYSGCKGELLTNAGVCGHVESVVNPTRFSNIVISGVMYNILCEDTQALYSSSSTNNNPNISTESISDSGLTILSSPN